MIEVEKQFWLTKEQREELTSGADFWDVQDIIDVYYDTSEYDLAFADKWLRKRNGTFELKYYTDCALDHFCCGSEVLLDDDIRDHLGIPASSAVFEQALNQAGYKPYVTLTTKRYKYDINNFTVDIDEVDYGYTVCEVELIVGDNDAVEQAQKDILNFARKRDWSTEPVYDKVSEYLRQFKPELFEKLVTAGVIPRLSQQT